jgi:alpha-tubulin suppressor-like RCC1 family protein
MSVTGAAGRRMIVAAGFVAATTVVAMAVPAAAAPRLVIPEAVNVVSWGVNNSGQLGDGTTGRGTDAPFPVTGLPRVNPVQVAVDPQDSDEFSVTLLSDGTVWGWGQGKFGELGDGSTSDSDVPVEAAGLAGVTQIAAGDSHVLALRSDGTVWTWGDDIDGLLGNGTAGAVTDAPAQVPGLTGVIQVAAGGDQSLALRSNGTVWAWGGNDLGDLGDGTTNPHDKPEQVPGLPGIARIAAGGVDSYAISASCTVYAWGNNSVGQLGNGTSGMTDFTTAAAPVPNLTGVTQVATSGIAVLALAGSNGQVWAWGDNRSGQLGDGSTTERDSPEETGLTGITGLAASLDESAAIRPDGTELTWGSNIGGLLGLGTEGPDADVLRPVQNPWLNGVTQVAMSEFYSLAVGRATATTVPSVLGQSTAQANRTLSAASLRVGTITDEADNNCNSIGKILSQNPAAGTTAQLGSAVAITIGTKPLNNPCP